MPVCVKKLRIWAGLKYASLAGGLDNTYIDNGVRYRLG